MDESFPQLQFDPSYSAANSAANLERRPTSSVLRAALKVPEITIFFWIVKLLTTAMGEATSDYMVFHLGNKYLAVGLGFVGFVVALALQFTVRRYIAWVYWLAALMVAIFGTMAADVLHVVLGVPYIASSIGFAVALAIIFFAWNRSERTLDIHSIYTFKRECFYWAAIVATFAMGTALGDLSAYTLGLGFFPSIVLFAILFALPAVGYRLIGFSGIAAFWLSYIMTRPLGASVADWLAKPVSETGLGFGDAWPSIALGLLIVLFVGMLTVSRADEPAQNAALPSLPGRLRR